MSSRPSQPKWAAKRSTPSRLVGHVRRRTRHTLRLSRHGIRYAIFLAGAACVALVSMSFAWLAEKALELNLVITHAGLPGGIFTPSLAIGAGIGEHLSVIFPGAHFSPGLLALLSMAGFLAAATQAPVTATVITMEMTGSHHLTLLLLAVTLLASFVSRQFCPRPFYHSASRHFRREAVALKPGAPPGQS